MENTSEPVTAEGPTRYQIMTLAALQSKHIYEGTVPHRVKLRRRAKGAVAKQTRKVNR